MREGWNDEDKYMIISAGLTPEKPDHQHGDMLGIQAYAYGNYILPNYQVRYSLNDLEYFKNSWVKNVCIADSIPQGQGWNMNSSGFGKWNNLPQPKVITWYKSDSFDYFCGQHEGYKNQEIEYYRQVFFLKNDFWIVKDQFISNKPHKYQQIWQGHYSIEEINKHIRSVFSNGAGLEIIQLNDSVNRIYQNSRRGKGMTIFEKHGNNGQSFTTLLYPFENFDECLLKSKISKIKDWNIKYNLNLSKELSKNFSCDAKTVIYNNKKFLLLSTSKLKIKNTEIEIQTGGADLWMISDDQNFNLLNADIKEIKVRIDGTLKNIKSGDEIPLLLK